ncbi:MAG: plasmid pRiA4b ORF-3 family protein [Chloroflexota bacterium]|nr:plasmid pRiA4b ORF-3 family protein [Chloroflexota bacterium]
MVLRVILRAQSGEELAEPPGRDLLISTTHTFVEIAAAIDRAFARWDVSHLHEFVLSDGKRIVAADDDGFEEGDLDETVETVASVDLTAGGSFEYVFDLGAGWEHRCTVLRDSIDPRAELGTEPTEIVAVFGWGTIPDQYGRVTPDSDED